MSGRAILKRKKWGTTCPNAQMRSGRGSKDRGEGVEPNYMITNNIFATEEGTTILVRHSREPSSHTIITQQ